MNILLVGAGQIGSRHLQGLSLLNHAAKITVVDPNKDSLKIAEQRYADISANKAAPEVIYQTNYQNLENTVVDFAIIATNSNVRRKITADLLQKVKVKNILLEKVLFQKASDYPAVQKLLAQADTQAWVNCPMRIWPGYQKLKSIMAQPPHGAQNIQMTVTGGSWGLACNSIHYIDIFNYLTNQMPLEVDTSLLNEAIIPSKRQGFFEVSGELTVHFENNNILRLHCDTNSSKPVQITIECNDQRHIVREDLKIATSSVSANGWAAEQWDFAIPYQSQLSGSVVTDVLQKGNTELPTYQQSAQIHLPLIQALSVFFETKLPIEHGETQCPIT